MSFKETMKREKVMLIIEKLKEKGVDALVDQIIKAFANEHPYLWECDHTVVRDFFRVFWAREYDIVASMICRYPELESITTQVEGKVLLECKRTGRSELERGITKFQSRSIDDLVEEALTYLEELYNRHPRDMSLTVSYADIDRILYGFWDSRYPSARFGHSPYSNFYWVKMRKVNEAVVPRWRKRVFDAKYERSSPSEKEKMRGLKEFLEKKSEELAEEIIRFFEEKDHWPALFDHSPQGRRRVIIEKFWSKRYPGARNKSELGGHKWWEVKELVDAKLPKLEKQVYNLILSDSLKLAKIKKKTSITKPEIREMLKTWGVFETPKRLEDDLFKDINARAQSRIN